jgi:hypothetical protein
MSYPSSIIFSPDGFHIQGEDLITASENQSSMLKGGYNIWCKYLFLTTKYI